MRLMFCAWLLAVGALFGACEDCDCGCKEGGECGCEAVESGCAIYCPAICYPNCWEDETCSLPSACKAKPGCWYEYIEYLPDRPPLFRPFVADPRQIGYSAGWRFNDRIIARNTIDVSYGDQFGLVRWFGVGSMNGELQLSVEGALWAVFDPLEESAPLVNADYYIGVPLCYRAGSWSWRLRAFHISSHLGDEFLLNNPDFDRRNPSAEYIDFYVSNNYKRGVRLYGGMGYIAHQDASFKLGRFYAEAGTEIRFFNLGFWSPCNQIIGVPLFAMQFRYNNYYNRQINQNYVLGYEFRKTQGTARRLRIYAQYYNGYSLEGQFSKYLVDYYSLRISYGY